MHQQQHHYRTVAVSALLGLLLLLPSMAVAQSTTAEMLMTSPTPTTPGGFTSEQLGVLIGIPVALVVIIFIGVIIGCVVLHKVHQEEKLLNGKPYRSDADRDGDTSVRPQQQYYSDYLNSQTKMR